MSIIYLDKIPRIEYQKGQKIEDQIHKISLKRKEIFQTTYLKDLVPFNKFKWLVSKIISKILAYLLSMNEVYTKIGHQAQNYDILLVVISIKLCSI